MLLKPSPVCWEVMRLKKAASHPTEQHYSWPSVFHSIFSLVDASWSFSCYSGTEKAFRIIQMFPFKVQTKMLIYYRAAAQIKGSFFCWNQNWLIKQRVQVEAWRCRYRWHKLSVSQLQMFSSCRCSTPPMSLQHSELKHAGRRPFMHDAEWSSRSVKGHVTAVSVERRWDSRFTCCCLLLWTKSCFIIF